MATSKPSQQTFLEAGESEYTPNAWPTPEAKQSNRRVETFDPVTGRVISASGNDFGMSLNQAVALTSSPGATPASHSHSPGSDWARRMTAISGQTCAGWSTLSGPVGCSLKTLLGTSRWASTLFYLTWKRTATPAGRSLYRLVPSTPSTGATGFGSWPTPKAGHEYRQHTAGAAEKEGRHGWKLPGAVADSLDPEPTRAWPTPTRQDSINARNATANRSPDSKPANIGWTLSDVMYEDWKKGQKLHGRWTLALMGFPPDWCDDLPLDPIAPE